MTETDFCFDHPNYLNVEVTSWESWKDIPGYESLYQVSSYGRVKSLFRYEKFGSTTGTRIRPRNEKILSTRTKHQDVHLQVGLYKDGVCNPRGVHCLVLEAFVGACPDGMQCCHNDGNEQNNNLENLRWDTLKANQYDRILHGTDCRGSKNSEAKLNESDILEIRKLGASGRTGRYLAKRYNVTPTMISYILRRKNWRHV